MEKNNKAKQKNETLDNEYYYRDQEMMRTVIESVHEKKDEDSE